VVAEYALRDMGKPIGVAQWQTWPVQSLVKPGEPSCPRVRCNALFVKTLPRAEDFILPIISTADTFAPRQGLGVTAQYGQ
jgi:hypothetical protein